MRNQERAPRTYELMTVLHPDVPEESLPQELDRISGFIATAGGSIIETLQDSPWGRRRLAYPIRSGGRDVRDGYYTVWHINLGPNRIDELERELKLDVQVIRYLVVSWEPKPVDPKAVEQAEIEAEDAAAEAYAAAQSASTAAEAAEESAIEPVAAEEARQELVAEAETADAVSLTAQAEQLEATGAELAVEAVAAVEDRAELQEEAAAAVQLAEELAADVDLPTGAVRAGGADCPDDYPVKGNASSMLYHSPGSPSYGRTNPEFCFESVEAAEAAGFKPTKYEAAHDENQ